MKFSSLVSRLAAVGVAATLLACGAVSAEAQEIMRDSLSGSDVAEGISTLGLTGSITDLKIKPNADGSTIQVKATVSVTNTNVSAVKHVGATVYLSADGTLSDNDMKLITIDLADFVAKGKIGKGKTVSFPIKKKVPSVLATYLEGKYIIVVPSVDDQTAGSPIVIGPIKVP